MPQSTSWTGTILENLGLLQNYATGPKFTERHGRVLLVSRMRWLMLLMTGAYCVVAASCYLFSSYGFFLDSSQMVILLVAVAAVISYNLIYQFGYEKIVHLPCIDHLQIVLDLLFTTILIHYSGGSASWFWPVYLVVTIESAVVIEKRAGVWILGAVGGAMYGALLFGEASGLLRNLSMPFVDATLYTDYLYLSLKWFWVSLLNAAVSIVAAFLMSIIREENAAAIRNEERLFDFLNRASDLIFHFSPEGKVLYANRAWKKALGFEEEIGDINLLDIVHDDSRAKCLLHVRKAVEGDSLNALEGRFVARDGRLIDVEGNLTRSVHNHETSLWSVCRDITSRKFAEQRLFHIAHHDALTGLPNRLYFLDQLRQARLVAKRFNHQIAILFLDLDRFKIINDTLGHGVGDLLLQEVAARIRTSVREIDTVARLGGDEFTVMLTNIKDDGDIEKVARKILQAIGKPVVIEGNELFITTSIGASVYPRHGDDPATLVKHADIAMYQAKQNGRNNWVYYDPSMNLDSDRRLSLETGMRKALDRDEFELHYQPKVHAVTGKITAIEALVRWHHPSMGFLYPREFIALAEETGLILQIGEWVLRRACTQNREWQDEGIAPVRMAVNLSGHQLQQTDIVARVKKILAETGLDPEYLELEVTETVIMQNPDFTVKVLGQLSDLGIHLAIDDFGTGYSSLAHLKRFQVNTLKMDKSFVRDLEINSTDAAIATAIISMGASLNLQITAEGVETEGQLSFLKEQMCDEIQGFLFSEALSASSVEKVLRVGRLDTKRVVGD